MRPLAGCLSLLALTASLLSACQKQPGTQPSGAANPVEKPAPRDPARRLWHAEKAKVFAAVGKCALAPSEAVRQLEQRRLELSPTVKDGRKLGFSPDRVKQIAKKAGCPGA